MYLGHIVRAEAPIDIVDSGHRGWGIRWIPRQLNPSRTQNYSLDTSGWTSRGCIERGVKREREREEGREGGRERGR